MAGGQVLPGLHQKEWVASWASLPIDAPAPTLVPFESTVPSVAPANREIGEGNMVRTRAMALVALMAVLAACGEPTVIDIVKDSHVAECSAASVGDMLIGYFPTTSWTAYNGETEGTYLIHGEGELQFVGVTQTANLRFVLDESDGTVTFDGATLNGEEQVPAMANQILETMCQDARG